MIAGGGLAIITAGEVILSLLIAVILARSLGVAGLGVYGIGLSLSMICVTLVEFGLPALVMREVAYADAERDYKLQFGIIYFSQTTVFILSLFFNIFCMDVFSDDYWCYV